MIFLINFFSRLIQLKLTQLNLITLNGVISMKWDFLINWIDIIFVDFIDQFFSG